jgi:hypothetical protein
MGTTLSLVHRFLSPWWWRRYVPVKRRFLQEPRGITSQKTPFYTFCTSSLWKVPWNPIISSLWIPGLRKYELDCGGVCLDCKVGRYIVSAFSSCKVFVRALHDCEATQASYSLLVLAISRCYSLSRRQALRPLLDYFLDWGPRVSRRWATRW